MLNFQDMIKELTRFWASKDCIVHQGYDLEVGAGTFNPATFLRSLGPEPYSAVYVEPSRRPKDGRYGENPNRLQHYHQMQVIIKPSPPTILEWYVDSLKAIGLNLNEHDIRFVHDDWENPTIGAWGLGWEVWLDGMEVSQFTYFQAVGGITVKPVSGEITYGLERLAMYLQGVDSIFKIKWNDKLTYGDIFQRSEWEWSKYNFEEANAQMWLSHFDAYEKEASKLVALNLPLPAYDFVMKASHAFNILDARGVISVSERTNYIGRIRNLAKQVAEGFIKSREFQEHPLLGETIARAIPTFKTVKTAYDPSQAKDFLLEIGSEELPASFVTCGASSLKEKMTSLLKNAQVAFKDIIIFSTPRRLTALVKGLHEGTLPQKIEKKGPSLSAAFDGTGKLTNAGEGFFRSVGIGSMNLNEAKQKGFVRDVKGVDYLFAEIEKLGVSTRALLASELPKLIGEIDFPKKMRWEDLDVEYARPIRWLVALYDDEEIPFMFGNVISGRTSHGHRQLAPFTFTLANVDEYEETLKKHSVICNPEERRRMILEGIAAIEKEEKAQAVAKNTLIDEVMNLVEWPFLLLGKFDKIFLDAPKEILISEMIQHQRYFPLEDTLGKLIPAFVIVCNNTPQETIRQGNQRALIPRLSDGRFLYLEDLKTPLDQFNEKLKTLIFQKSLGSMWAKVERIKANVEILHSFLPQFPLETTKRAATICKADLVTLLVGEFPDLQGIIGKLYALKQGEKNEVAIAIDEHWMPRGEKSPLPISLNGIALSLADKIDNFLSCFSLELIPTSSSDPFALRRQAIGLIKMVIENKFPLPLKKVLAACFEKFIQNNEMHPKVKEKAITRKNEIFSEIEEFVSTRMRGVFLEMGFEKDEIESVLSKGTDDIYHNYLLLKSLHEFRLSSHDKFIKALSAHTRVKKMLVTQKQEKLIEKLLNEETEKNLYLKVQSLSKRLVSLQNEKKYGEALGLLSELEEPLAKLFDALKIMDDNKEIRQNRLALLFEVKNLLEQLIDFTKIQEHHS